MTERASRIILGVEAMIIGLPLSLLFLVGGLPSAFYKFSLFPDAESLAFASVCLIILATLCSAWVLILGFAFRGSATLQRFSTYWWVLPFLVAGLSIAATLRLWISDKIEPSAINTFGWGLPFLIPLMHLSLERWFRNGESDPQQGPR